MVTEDKMTYTLSREQIAEQIMARIREGGEYTLATRLYKASFTGNAWK